MKHWILPLTLCFVTLFAASSQSQVVQEAQKSEEDYEAAIADLAKGTPEEKTTAAIQLLQDAATDAFPVLLANLDNQSKASPKLFMRAVMGRDAEGNAIPYEPIISDICFGLLQGQIEGNWPKGYRHHYVLNELNIRDWLKERKDKTLKQLQIECATLALESAKLEHEQNPSNWTESCMKYLTKNLERVQNQQ